MRHVVGMIKPSIDQRPIGIAFDELDDHFLADPRNVHSAKALARPRLADAHPARGIFIFLAVAVPVKLHFHAGVFVDMYLLARRTDDSSRLDALDNRLGCDTRGAKGGRRGNSAEAGG